MSTLGEIIKKFRESQNPEISIRKFAEKCNLSYSYISMLERNKDPRGNPIVPTINTIFKVAEAMNMDFDDVFNQLDDDYNIKVNHTDKYLNYVTIEDGHIIPIEYYEKEKNEPYGRILSYLEKLNDKGIIDVENYLDMMISSGKYKKEE